jgi:UDP-glucose 4-epimerase
MNILVTGGAGYIGSHTCIELANAGFNPIVIDNLSNATSNSLIKVEKITGKKVTFYNFDVRDENQLEQIFKKHNIITVIHFAGFKSLPESLEKPIEYFANNISSTLVLCKVMKKYNCKRIIFSSSASVYGEPKSLPIKENFPLSASNPYARSKLMIEEILRDLFNAENNWHIALLRYFNPVGAHESGMIGEASNAVPGNLMPYIALVARKNLDKLRIFGDDYNTHDGTGIRDYIHVVDLAKGHLKAIKFLESGPCLTPINLSTGNGYSVLDIVKAFENASGKSIPYEIVARRKGDVASCFGDPTFAEQVLDWKAEYDLERMCEDTWRWITKNPGGYISMR